MTNSADGRGPPGKLRPVVLATAVVAALCVALGVWLWSSAPPTPLGGIGVPASVRPIGTEQPSAQIEAIGRLLLPLDAGLSRVDLPGRAIAELVAPGRSGAVTGARWTPDGRAATYAYYHVRSGDASASSEIYQTDPSGEPRLLVARDKPGSVVESPEWTPDGSTLYFSFSTLENQRVVRRIERLDLATGSRSSVTDGLFPSISPDGTQMVFIRPDGGGDSLVLSAIDGQNGRVLIPSGRYSALATARFSPDGRTLAIPISSPTHTANEPRPWPLFGALRAGVAHAHGDPWDVYLVDVAGGEPRRLTRLLDDEINIAWSPDGSQVAVYGSRGLYLAALDGKTTFALDRGGYGGIDWGR